MAGRIRVPGVKKRNKESASLFACMGQGSEPFSKKTLYSIMPGIIARNWPLNVYAKPNISIAPYGCLLLQNNPRRKQANPGVIPLNWMGYTSDNGMEIHTVSMTSARI